jgi:hypothetical protein
MPPWPSTSVLALAPGGASLARDIALAPAGVRVVPAMAFHHVALDGCATPIFAGPGRRDCPAHRRARRNALP